MSDVFNPLGQLLQVREREREKGQQEESAEAWRTRGELISGTVVSRGTYSRGRCERRGLLVTWVFQLRLIIRDPVRRLLWLR